MTRANSKMSISESNRYWGYTSGSYFSRSKTFDSDVIVGVSDPDFQVKIARLEDATNNYSRRVYNQVQRGTYQCSDVTTLATIPPTVLRSSGLSYLAPAGVGSDVVPSNSFAESVALERIKKKLRNHQGYVNTLVPVAELRELHGTIHSLANSSITLVRSLIDIKHGKFRDAHKRASDLWLTWSFGIKPMLNDAEDIANAIATHNFRSEQNMRRVSAGFQYEWSSVGATDQSQVSALSLVQRTPLESHSLQITYTAGMIFPIRTSNDYSLFSQFGLEFGSLPSTAWELIPYSWLVDYFTNVGTFVEDTFHTTSARTVYLNKSVLYRKNVSFKNRFTASAPTIVVSSSADDTPYAFTSFTRSKLVSLPPTQLRYKSRSEIARNSINKLLNLTSVLSVRNLKRS